MPQIFMPLKALPMELDESFTPVEAINKILFKLNETIYNINNLYDIKLDKFIGIDKAGYFLKVNLDGYVEPMESSGTTIQWGDITGIIGQQIDMVNLIASMINTAISPIQSAIQTINTTIGTWTSTLGADIATAIQTINSTINIIEHNIIETNYIENVLISAKESDNIITINGSFSLAGSVNIPALTKLFKIQNYTGTKNNFGNIYLWDANIYIPIYVNTYGDVITRRAFELPSAGGSYGFITITGHK